MISADRAQPAASFGDLLRDWRRRRRLSKLGLASEVEVAQQHLSCIESGRSRPSREMVLHLAAQLELPLREGNRLLLAAGYAPIARERPPDDPALREAMAAIEVVLRQHAPYPALAIDRAWTLRAAHRMVPVLIGLVAPQLLEPPVNVIRLSLPPEGLAPRIRNLPVWRAHVLARLRRSADRFLADPARYAPAFNGYRASGVAQGYKVPASPQRWTLVEGRLYLTYDRLVPDRWEQDIPGYLADAQAAWPALDPSPASADPVAEPLEQPAPAP